MDKLHYRENALKNLKSAEYVFYVTYPLVQDPKILKIVIKKLYSAILNSMAILNNGNSELSETLFAKNGLSLGYIKIIRDIKKIVEKQRLAEVEFCRKGNLVFASKDYNLDIITNSDIKDYIIKTKLLVNHVMQVNVQK